MIWIWRYILGFLVVKISGENSEKFINLAAANGINIWNLYWKNGFIYGNVSINNFKKFFSIRHRVKCKISIVKRYGLTNKTKKYKKRLGLYLGAILFFSILYLLTNFVWTINISGNLVISDQSVKSSCSKLGIKEGILKGKLNSKYDAQRLQLTQDGISWCSFNVEGCVLNINLTETIKTDKETRENPCNIKAVVDGKITKINVTNGEVKIKVGDIVSKGDLLVSGVTQNATSTVFVHSSGEIIAETKREFSAQGDFEQKQIQETNKTFNRKTIGLFGFKIPLFLGNIKEPNNYNIKTKNLTLFGNKIPIKLASERYVLTKEITIKYTKDELKNILLKNIKDQLDKFKFLSAEIIRTEVIENDKGMLVKVAYKCTENIAKSEEILLSKVN